MGSLTLPPHFVALSVAPSLTLIFLCHLSISFQRVHVPLLHKELSFETSSKKDFVHLNLYWSPLLC